MSCVQTVYQCNNYINTYYYLLLRVITYFPTEMLFHDKSELKRNPKPCRVSWLFDLALSDPQPARQQALQYIASNRPDLASKICYVTIDSGDKISFIQLQCLYERCSAKTALDRQCTRIRLVATSFCCERAIWQTSVHCPGFC